MRTNTKNHAWRCLSVIAKILLSLKAVNVYGRKNNKCYGMMFRMWNPIVWVVILIYILLSFITSIIDRSVSRTFIQGIIDTVRGPIDTSDVIWYRDMK